MEPKLDPPTNESWPHGTSPFLPVHVLQTGTHGRDCMKAASRTENPNREAVRNEPTTSIEETEPNKPNRKTAFSVKLVPN